MLPDLLPGRGDLGCTGELQLHAIDPREEELRLSWALLKTEAPKHGGSLTYSTEPMTGVDT